MKVVVDPFIMLEALLDDHAEELEERFETAFKAFTEWRTKKNANPYFVLSSKQSAWLYGVAEQLGAIEAAPAENVFSRLSPARQEEQRLRAAAVKLPWEKNVVDDVVRFLVGQQEDGSFVVREVRARFVEADGKRGYICRLRSCATSSMIEFVPEEKVYETVMAAITRKKELEKGIRR